MNYTISDIQSILKADFKKGNAYSPTPINQVLTDSRRLHRHSGTLFFALETDNRSGTDYIQELYQSGVNHFVIQNPNFITEHYPKAAFLIVENSLKALQNLATYHRHQYAIPVVGITGSNGKTIVKEWLFDILKNEYRVSRSPRSYNSQIGVPLSVLLLNKDTQWAIFEAGISQKNEMNYLSPIIQAEVGIFTNIGQAHQENFNKLEEKIQEKLNLFKDSKTLIYCKDHSLVHQEIQKTNYLKKQTLLTWSVKEESDLQILSKETKQHSILLNALYKGQNINLEIPFTDRASLENLMPIWLLLLHLDFSTEWIQNKVSALHPVAMRLEQKEGINACTIINDSYNSDLNSLSIALDVLANQDTDKQKILILSDIIQSGQNTEQLYSEVNHLIKNKQVDYLIGIGENITKSQNIFDINKEFYPDTTSFLKAKSSQDFSHSAILLKGARKFAFEKISNFLQKKNHETILEVNLSHLQHNIMVYRRHLQPKVKIMAMVKAFSYGAGAYEIANFLQFHQIDYLTVAYADEGIQLRELGIQLPIMVMNPDEQSLELMLKYDLEPEIYSFSILKAYAQTLKKSAYTEGHIHLKIETGMNRLGFSEEEIPQLISFIKEHQALKIASVFSHLVGSDNPDLDDFTKTQIQRYQKISKTILKAFNYPIIQHIANSNAAIRFPEAQMDMIRLGIGMYGICPSIQNDLKTVNSLYTVISQIKTVEKGETIGYNRQGKLAETGRIATIPIGYADGLNRLLSQGKGKVYINGQLAPIVGNICMDMCMLDVTDVDCQEGDRVEIFGENQSVSVLSNAIGTIEYELFTGISQRVKRIYIQE